MRDKVQNHTLKGKIGCRSKLNGKIALLIGCGK